MSNDIVTRLRLRPTILRKNQFGDIETDRAATALFDDCHAIMREAADEIERLRAERDEARREVCQKHDHGYFMDEDYAEIRGWDCFKEAGK